MQKAVVWIENPQKKTAIMQDLVFNRGFLVWGADNWDQFSDLFMALVDISLIVVGDPKHKERLEQRGTLETPVSLVGDNPPEEPKSAVDGFLFRGLNKAARWVSNYGVTGIPTGIAALCLRGYFEIERLMGRGRVYMKMYGSRSGHLAYNTSVFITAMNGKRRIIPVTTGATADPYLFSLLCRQMGSFPSPKWTKYLSKPILAYSDFLADSWQYTDVFEPIQKYGSEYKVNLAGQMSQSEVWDSYKDLATLGIKLPIKVHINNKPLDVEPTPYVVIHVRDSEYLQKTQPGHDWGYHGFRDADLARYLQAATWLHDQDLKPVRIGIETNQAISEGLQDIILDYAQEDQDPMRDLILIQFAKFMLGSNSGVTQVAQALHVPVAAVNWAQLELLTTFRHGDLFIPKRIVDVDGNCLPLSMILEKGVGRFTRAEHFDQARIYPKENSPGEIKDLAEEMNARLDGTWENGKNDIQNQARFQKIINSAPYLCNGTVVRCGAKFLRENEWMLK
jgi:putative glycosyltransferase (TIGR04372 family)